MRRYILILIAISPPFTCPKSWTKKRKCVQLGSFSTLLNRAQIDGITKTLAANNTDITTQIYTKYGLTNNLEASIVVPMKLA
jgi:hypothetical protein